MSIEVLGNLLSAQSGVAALVLAMSVGLLAWRLLSGATARTPAPLRIPARADARVTLRRGRSDGGYRRSI